MPKKYKPLTQEEKNEILRKHETYVERFNSKFGALKDVEYVLNEEANVQVSLLEEDEYLNERLEDEHEVAIYRLSQEIKEIHDTQDALYNDLASRFGTSQSDADLLIKRSLKTDNTKFAKEYNEKLYQDFVENPDKTIAMLYRKVMNYNTDELVQVGTDKVDLLEYYKNNHEVIDLADSMESFRKYASSFDQNEEFLNAIDGNLREPLKVIAYPARLARLGAEPEYFALPHVYKDQAEIINNYNKENNIKDSPLVKEYLENCEDETMSESFIPANYIKGIEEQTEKKVNMKFFLNTYPMVGNKKVNFSKYNEPFNNEKILLKRRTNEQVNSISHINKEYNKVYTKKWGNALNEKLGIRGEFNFANIKSMHKGSFGERWLIFSTSRAYKDFIKQMELFHNPNSEDFANEGLLKHTADAYLAHKGVTSEADFARFKGTSLKRIKLAWATSTMGRNKETIEAQADNELAKDLPPKKENIVGLDNLVNTDNNIIKENDKEIKNEINNNIEVEGEEIGMGENN